MIIIPRYRALQLITKFRTFEKIIYSKGGTSISATFIKEWATKHWRVLIWIKVYLLWLYVHKFENWIFPIKKVNCRVIMSHVEEVNEEANPKVLSWLSSKLKLPRLSNSFVLHDLKLLHSFQIFLGLGGFQTFHICSKNCSSPENGLLFLQGYRFTSGIIFNGLIIFLFRALSFRFLLVNSKWLLALLRLFNLDSVFFWVLFLRILWRVNGWLTIIIATLIILECDFTLLCLS